MCAKPFPAVLIVSTLFEKTVGDPDPPSTYKAAIEWNSGEKTPYTFSHQHFECRCEDVAQKVGSMENKVSLIDWSAGSLDESPTSRPQSVPFSVLYTTPWRSPTSWRYWLDFLLTFIDSSANIKTIIIIRHYIFLEPAFWATLPLLYTVHWNTAHTGIVQHMYYWRSTPTVPYTLLFVLYSKPVYYCCITTKQLYYCCILYV